jgi:hypothetical protein
LPSVASEYANQAAKLPRSRKIRAVFVCSAARVIASFFPSPGGARLRSHFSICSINILIAASIMDSLVLKFCEELAIAGSDAMEFVDEERGLFAWCEGKLRSCVAWRDPKAYISSASGKLRLIFPQLQGS